MKKGQVWVETVIYTLIAFVLIGAVLAFVKPKIEEIQDKAIIEQSIEVLNGIESKMSEIKQGGVGNKRELELKIKKGILKIDGANDKLFFEIDSKYMYSQLGAEVTDNYITSYTEKKGDYYFVRLTRDYGGVYDIKCKGEEETSINYAATSHHLFVSNYGLLGGKTVINFEVA